MKENELRSKVLTCLNESDKLIFSSAVSWLEQGVIVKKSPPKYPIAPPLESDSTSTK